MHIRTIFTQFNHIRKNTFLVMPVSSVLLKWRQLKCMVHLHCLFSNACIFFFRRSWGVSFGCDWNTNLQIRTKQNLNVWILVNQATELQELIITGEALGLSELQGFNYSTALYMLSILCPKFILYSTTMLLGTHRISVNSHTKFLNKTQGTYVTHGRREIYSLKHCNLSLVSKCNFLSRAS